ncbi:C45 family autoproteolytic acyltransferase/hydrolase [Promethearchaeum syntrophicum]|uniref:C45 family autoproteolytic acyltransferase/hydrolase n=1 Tax=Promethearchaeum syntrophicum TaxID=2594042 RepID=A0A5B9DDR2_9ARCH|nr:C45 family autoproteolytic acyltransferase/hydolase [Candidatus Prometheoarchaeum syntrophicum]QEE16930.1 hypothetical protein DSAG12_02761 [Candidatus Prometheoarchaeum syntrophicum]
MSKVKVKKSKENKIKISKIKSIENGSMKSKRSNKILSIFLMFIIITMILYGSTRIFSLRHVEGEAEWKESNSQPYLYVSAENSYDLGYLTGKNLYKQIFSLKNLLLLMSPQFDTSYSDLKKLALEYVPFIPREHIDEMNGIAEGATNSLGITINFNDILIQNTWFDILYGKIIPEKTEEIEIDPLGCTAISVMNNGSFPVFGQNFDFTLIFKSCTSFVLHKLGNNPAIFGIKFGAALNFPIGKNENGVSVLTTIIKTNVISSMMIPTSCRTRLAFEQSQNASSYVELFYEIIGNNQSIGFTSIIIDNTNMFAVDVAPNNTNILSPISIVRTNTFVNESWQKFLVDPNYSKDRQNEAEIQLKVKLEDSNFSYNDLIDILQSAPLIFRKTDNKKDIATLALFTCINYAIENLENKEWGCIPI